MVRNAIIQLPSKYSQILVLSHLEQHSLKETAERLHLSVAAVKSRLLRARVMLSHILRPFEPKTRQRRAEVPSIAITSAETVLDKITKARGHNDAHRHNSGCGAAYGG